jgi:transposase
VRNLDRVSEQWEDLGRRLKAAEQDLQALGQAPGEEVAPVQEKVAEILKRHRVGEYLRVDVAAQARYRKVYEGPGRPGPQRSYHRKRYYEIPLRVQREEARLEEFLQLAGWRIQVTHATPEQLSLAEGVERYQGQWQPERGFHRWKGGEVPMVPLYVRDDDRIRGLVVILGWALRLLTLLEYVVREQLAQEEENTVAGLYAGNPQRATARPTAEKMRRAFRGMRRWEGVGPEGREVGVTPLNALQKRLLKLMGLPETIYTDLARPVEKSVRAP